MAKKPKKAKKLKQWHFKDKKSGEFVLLPVLKKVVTITKTGKKRLYLKAEVDGAKYSRQVQFKVFKKIAAPVERD